MEHNAFMARCIELASNGLGTTYPNPMVGSVIVHNGKIIGEGWHQKAGSAHAEVNAINSVPDKSLLKESTLYVNLEPCSHFGRTPPCANLIIDSKIPKVVIGNRDPNPVVAGNGIEKLINAGISVTDGILESECRELNKRFFTFHEKKRPFIILKWAQSADGFFAPEKHAGPYWISGALSRQLVHKMRAEEHAILVGTNTVLADNPSLNVRDWTGNDPLRFAIDRLAKIPAESNIFGTQGAVLFTGATSAASDFEIIDFSQSVPNQILEKMYLRNVQSVIVEGGARTLSAFIAQDLWDEAFVFTGNAILQNGIVAPKIKFGRRRSEKVGDDELLIFTK